MAKKKTTEPLRLNRLKHILIDKNISQKDFGRMMNVDRNTISRICNNRHQPSLQFLYDVAYFFDVEIQDLLTPISNLEKYFLEVKKPKLNSHINTSGKKI